MVWLERGFFFQAEDGIRAIGVTGVQACALPICSSRASAKQFKKAGEIIRADKARHYVVPTAPGKRSKTDEKVTDMLYACYDEIGSASGRERV